MTLNNKPILGIDLGTSFVTAAFWNQKSGMPEIIRNELGDERTPSWMCMESSGWMFGKAALEQMAESEHVPPEEQADMLARTFRCDKHQLKDNLPRALPDGRAMVPVEMVAAMLAHQKTGAESRCFHQEIGRVVLTHPAGFSAREKERLCEAGTNAGFHEVSLLEEPVAAALGYQAMGGQIGAGVLVFDWGGSRLNLAFLQRDTDGVFNVPVEPIACEFGGDDADLALYNYWDAILRDKYGQGLSPAPDQVNLAALLECRRCKEKLAVAGNAKMNRFIAGPNIHVQVTIDRNEFESLICPNLDAQTASVRGFLDQAAAAGHKVDTVLIVGGSTRIPLLRCALHKIVPVSITETMYMDTLAALGAAASARQSNVRRPEQSTPHKMVSTAPLKELPPPHLKIITVPEGAEVLLDSKRVGTTPCAVVTNAGEHSLVITKNGFNTVQQKVAINEWEDKSLNIALQSFSGLRVVTDPPGATIRVNGDLIKERVSPMDLNLEPGTYYIEASKIRWNESGMRLQYTGSEGACIKISLKRCRKERNNILKQIVVNAALVTGVVVLEYWLLHWIFWRAGNKLYLNDIECAIYGIATLLITSFGIIRTMRLFNGLVGLRKDCID